MPDTKGIRQFVTILSLNKTRGTDGRSASIFIFMQKKIRRTVQAAIIASLYIVLTHGQNLLLPGSASMAIQFRASEALCVLAFFTPAAVQGLGIGCLIFNLTAGAGLPLDMLVGTLATVLAGLGIRATRRITVKGWPLPGLMLPVLTNAILVGWELSATMGGGFWINAGYVALGEGAVMLTLGTALYYALKNRKLDRQLFG